MRVLQPEYAIPIYSIQYCHRTAREFNEDEATWSDLVLQAENADFDPNYALMRSSIITLQLTLASSDGHGRSVTLDLLADIMLYAQKAEAHRSSQDARIVLLRQVKEMLITRYEGECWAVRLGFRYSKNVDSFLELAMVYGVQSYVHEEISKLQESKEDLQSQKVATSLLYTLVSTQSYNYPRPFPLPTVAMARLLIYLGADINSSLRKKSPWKLLLDNEGSTKVSIEPLRKRDIEIMTVLVPCCADVNIRVDCKLASGEESHSVLDFVENFLLPAFPVEAGPLLDAVQEKLGMK